MLDDDVKWQAMGRFRIGCAERLEKEGTLRYRQRLGFVTPSAPDPITQRPEEIRVIGGGGRNGVMRHVEISDEIDRKPELPDLFIGDGNGAPSNRDFSRRFARHMPHRTINKLAFDGTPSASMQRQVCPARQTSSG